MKDTFAELNGYKFVKDLAFRQDGNHTAKLEMEIEIKYWNEEVKYIITRDGIKSSWYDLRNAILTYEMPFSQENKPVAPPKVDINKVMSVYSGKDGACCCGCSGKHTYASKHVDIASKHRGYKVMEDEVNDKVVKMIVNKINKVWDGKLDGIKENDDSDYTSVVVGTRVYIAYYLPERA